MNTQRPGSRSYVPCSEDGVPELWEDEALSFELANCEISFNATTGALGSGKLYITTKRLLWIGDSVDSAFDYDIAYIVLHAVSRDVESYPKACVYCQLDIESNGDDEEEEEDSEVFLIPSQEEDIMKIFDALSHAALLNPDPEDDEDDLEGDFIYDGEEVALGAEQARILDHLESVFTFPEEDGDVDGQYDDAEDEGDEDEGEEHQ